MNLPVDKMNNKMNNIHLDHELLPDHNYTSDNCEATHNAENIAEQQFAHGLLEYYHNDNENRQKIRVANVMSAITRESKSTAKFIRPVLFNKLPRWSVLSGMAAAILIMVVLITTLIPTEQTALAVLQDTISASNSAGDRSYQIRMLRAGQTYISDTPHGWMDIRDNEHLVLRILHPDGSKLILGRNPDGAWNIKLDGSIDYYSPDWVWPKWVDFGERTLLIQSIDDMLQTLPTKYDLNLTQKEPVPDTSQPICQHVVATLINKSDPGPNEVELWIDPVSKLVLRMELHWPVTNHVKDNEQRDDSRPPLRQRPPALLHESPPFETPHTPPPPSVMIFELISTDPITDEWFNPETHQSNNGN